MFLAPRGHKGHLSEQRIKIDKNVNGGNALIVIGALVKRKQSSASLCHASTPKIVYLWIIEVDWRLDLNPEAENYELW